MDRRVPCYPHSVWQLPSEGCWVVRHHVLPRLWILRHLRHHDGVILEPGWRDGADLDDPGRILVAYIQRVPLAQTW